MRAIKLICVTAILSIPMLCSAATSDQNKASSKQKVETMSCEQFTTMADVDKPKVVYYALGHFQGGEKAGLIDIQNTERLIPMVITECAAAPKESFWKKLKEKAKQVF